ncbi:MAG: glutamine synthetase III [Bacteroidetes bacterium]|uniref:Glutamine synthetase III n=1 Tax=Candidatus Cryptobacteroides merdavium TaxID=2840769 RepID=A0A9D9HB04_9BACT|nr:glutamine synthetase III [Candidatus Cryptobacteroides merdavium]
MAAFRQRALNEAASHHAERFFVEDGPVSRYFGQNVLDLNKMRSYMSKQAYEAVLAAVKFGAKLDRSVSNEIASGMKAWAMEMGATHYTHLFHPLTDATAEKHEAFIVVKDGQAFERFSGSALVQQEPDASSFPNGGLRNTFEARGYSAWDPSSPVFILDGTLCIPSVFVSYTGEALDTKVPNLKSLQALSDAASSVAQLFDASVTSVHVNLGLEQEYFLVDESLYNARPDLVLCDRTVIGHTSAKDQQLEDHYFGAIPTKVSAFMKDFETEAYKLGILLQTRHNEVAPNQFECAPVYCEATKAIDQNMMLMIIMQKVAEKHHLKVIFHEKPFDGVNGSGKHCNWSMVTDTGVNLLSPGKTPTKNLQFLSFYASVIKAVHDHHFLLMTSIATLSNSYRLGGNEAPPAVMSVFSGSTLFNIFQAIENMQDLHDDAVNQESIKIVNSIPEIFPDNTDRNRTSPFAFTGNRFEFRAVGSSVNVASAVYVLNSIVAESLKNFRKEVDVLTAKGEELSNAVMAVVRKFIHESKNIMFEGNGYSKEWEEESRRRGLRAVTNVPEAYEVYHEQKTVDLFSELGVLAPNEVEARFEVLNETYVKKLQIEARVIGDICLNHVLPAAIRYQNVLVENVKGVKDVFGDEYAELCASEVATLRKISAFINRMSSDVEALVEARKRANRIEDIAERAKVYSHEVKDLMDKVRYSADHLEMLVDDEMWPLPKYRELLFI